MTRRQSGRRTAFLGVRTRLLGLVLIPSLGLTLFAGTQVGEHRRLSIQAERLADDVDAAAVALDAFVATTQEYRLVETAQYAGRFGISVAQAGAMLGMDLPTEMALVRVRIDRNPLLPALLERAAGSDDLDRARTFLDSYGENDPVFGSLVVEAEQAWKSRRDRMLDGDNTAAIDPSLRRTLHALRASAGLFEAANELLLLVSDTVLPGSTWRRSSVASLDEMVARYDVALAEAASETDADVEDAMQAVVDERAFHDVLAGYDDGEVFDVDDLAAIFSTGLRRDTRIQELATAVATDARTHALEVGDAARARYTRTVAVVVALLTATLVLALLVARSIAVPLRRLARRAAEVSDGELDGPPLPLAGPREAAVLAGTINDAVGNLRAVEAQMAALAAGDTAPAPAPIPGKLGALVGRSVEGLARSMAERDELQTRLAHEAARDPLTGLANRRTAMETLDAMLGSAARIALLFLDFDGFKRVNDEQGHAVGDALLEVAAGRLADAAPAGALVARLGGDEFVVALAVADDRDAADLAQRLVDLLDEQVQIGGLPHRVAACVGVAVARPGDDADRLLRSADAALYEAKRLGRATVVVLDDGLRQALEEEHRLEAELRLAIAADDLELAYQPVFRTTGELHGVEALVRWRQADGTLVPPDEFVPAAERTGLIVELDRWVLRRSLEQVGEWRRGPLPGIRLAVNASASTLLSTHFVHDVAAALHHARVEGAALTVEVTETALLHDLDTAAERIGHLAELGVGTSVDDFGTGYTSVSHLRRLPIRELKIDRSFIQAMDGDDRDRVLVDLMVRIGSTLHLDVVAEGVETEEQLESVRRLGCFAQGYLLGRPVPAAQLVADRAGTPIGA